jgi:hypothetical protein
LSVFLFLFLCFSFAWPDQKPDEGHRVGSSQGSLSQGSERITNQKLTFLKVMVQVEVDGTPWASSSVTVVETQDWVGGMEEGRQREEEMDPGGESGGRTLKRLRG